MHITRRDGLLAGLSGFIASLFGIGPVEAKRERGAVVDGFAPCAGLPSFETKQGRFDVVYSSVDLSAFEVGFEPEKDRLTLKGAQNVHERYGERPAYVGLVGIKFANEMTARGANGLFSRVHAPHIYLLYANIERNCVSAERLPWAATALLLPKEFDEFCAALKRWRGEEAAAYVASRQVLA